MLWKIEKSLVPAGNRASICRILLMITIEPELDIHYIVEQAVRENGSTPQQNSQ
jgi:hypothetical protein